jgi:hypothetical protein
MKIKQCDNCKYFDQIKDRIYGLCRRYPPTPMMLKGYETPDSFHSETNVDGWCGEYKQEENT